jgi:hypothetical protein
MARPPCYRTFLLLWHRLRISSRTFFHASVVRLLKYQHAWRIIRIMNWRCENCGKKQPRVVVTLVRHRKEGGALHTESWCLECVQGKNPIRQQFDIPTEWSD